MLFLCRSLASSDLLGPCRQRLAAYLSAASLVSSASAISIAALASREPKDTAARCEPAFFGASDESAEARAPASTA